MNLDTEQIVAVEQAVASVKRRDRDYRIAGYAGTGKTTIMRYIVEQSGLRVRTCAFTGKAANVLRQKGLPKSETIHRTMYEWDDHAERFIKRPTLECDAIGVDEGSMVPVSIWNDLLSYRLPIIVVGDPGQLEPIGDDAQLMHNPHIVLEKIHRYEGSIAWFANYVRQNDGRIPNVNSDEVSVRRKDRIMADIAGGDVDVWLCGFNKTRVAMNKQIRQRLGHEDFLCRKDKIVFLHNDRELGVFNGQGGEVLRVTAESTRWVLADVLLDDGRTKHNLKIWRDHFGSVASIDWRKYPKGMAIADYGYALTVHKFQGSEDKRIAVIDEQCDLWEPVRHRYTAFTRAKERLIVYVD